MKCPFCKSLQVMVVNSRTNCDNNQIWRRRKCLSCGEVHTTYEKIDLSYIKVIKKSGKKVRFQRAKLFSGIYHSCLDKKKVDRGDAGKFAEEVTRKVEAEIIRLKKKEIRSKEITEIVLSILAKESPDTFLIFLAYREGSDENKLRGLLGKYFKS